MKLVSQFGKFLVVALAILLGSMANSHAFLDGTNAVSMIEDNVTNASNVIWPLVIGIIAALVALSVVFKVGRKGGIRT